MPQTTTIDREWVKDHLVKWLETERSLSAEARSRAESPPDPALSVLYHEISEADERHAAVLERVAARYGHTPAETSSGGIGEALGQLKNRVAELTSSPVDQVCADLDAKARSIHLSTALIHALEGVGESESAKDLSSVVTEEESHRDALQRGLDRLVEQLARGGEG